MRDEHIEVILRGRKFKKMIDDVYEGVRDKYKLKQIELELMLYINEKPLSSASDIYRALNLNKGQVSQALVVLCEKDFLETRPDREDRRYVYYEIAAEGQPVIGKCQEINERMSKKLFQNLDSDELEMMKKITQKICKNIDMISGEKR